jgi:hypothetical protein
VSQFGVLPQLKQILKRFPKEDSINGRVFRVVGNLCQHRDQWATVIMDRKPHIVIHIVKFLRYTVDTKGVKVSEATINMGLRSLRELLNRDTLKALVKTYGVLKTVGMLLIKYGGIWQETKRGESILTNIIKLLQEYSRYRYYPSIIEMRNTEMGDSIVYLSKILLVAPREIIKIVMNFLKISQLKSDLPVPEIFDGLISVLRDDAIIQEFNNTCIECIKCLCHLLEHPGNRNNDSCGDSIPLLVQVLNGLTLQSNNKVVIRRTKATKHESDSFLFPDRVLHLDRVDAEQMQVSRRHDLRSDQVRHHQRPEREAETDSGRCGDHAHLARQRQETKEELRVEVQEQQAESCLDRRRRKLGAGVGQGFDFVRFEERRSEGFDVEQRRRNRHFVLQREVRLQPHVEQRIGDGHVVDFGAVARVQPPVVRLR